MTNEQLEANRNCPYGGGRKDCGCAGNCIYVAANVVAAKLIDNEPRCDCGYLFEICNHPNCESGAINTQQCIFISHFNR